MLLKKRYIIKIILISLIVSCTSDSLTEAANYTYDSSQASAISSKTFVAGDVITLKNGTWNNKSITIKGNGTKDNPIFVNAQNAGEVVLTGSSRLTIDGKYIEVSGLLFSGNATVGKNHVVTFSKNSSNCRFTNSAIKDYNPSDNSVWQTTDNKWVSLHGKSNRVDHCYFENKGNIGTLLVVWLVSGQSANHRIDHNHFYKRVSLLDENEKELNGQETIRIGDSSTSMTNANCVIEDNFFEECDGEIEIISNKSCGNIYRNNVFYNNNGMLTLRHGNACEVSGNYFFGESKSGSGGVRIIGEDHKVFNNYFQDLNGSGYRTAVCIVNGKENSALNEYFQVKNALVAFNTFYNCQNSFNVGYNGGNDLPPLNLTIAHNVVYASTTKQTGVKMSDSNSQVTWKNNLMYQGKFTSFSPADSEFKRTTTNLNFQSSNPDYGIYVPQANSLIVNQYKTTDFSAINKDIEGRTRPDEKMIGAFEHQGNPSVAMPTPETVGCSFINKYGSGTGIVNPLSYDNLIDNIRFEDSFLHVESNSGELSLQIYNQNGRLLNAQLMNSSTSNFSFSMPDFLSGFYFFVFCSGYKKEVRKMLLL